MEYPFGKRLLLHFFIRTHMPERSVAAINDGTVIDHLPSGSAGKLITLLSLTSSESETTIGLSLPSPSRGKKDIIKMNGRFLTKKEQHIIAAVAPGATINTIRHFNVTEKITLSLPHQVQGIFSCPNPRCVSNHEHLETIFETQSDTEIPSARCRFCERIFSMLHLSTPESLSHEKTTTKK
jgi:aspartate carbamoyltransferase regulatory subunit